MRKGGQPEDRQRQGTASPAGLTAVSHGAGTSSREEKAGNDPTRQAQPLPVLGRRWTRKGQGSLGSGIPRRWQDKECSCSRSRTGNRHSKG